MKRKFFWQPETAISLIYWSVTFIILFYSLIMSLENTRPYWGSNLVLGIFLVFVYLGFHRRLLLGEKSLKIIYARFWKKELILYKDIQRIQIADKKFQLQLKQKTISFYFRKKDSVLLKEFFLNKFPEKCHIFQPEPED